MVGYLYVLLAAALWALLGPVSRLVLREGVAPLEIALWRCVIGTALFALHVAASRSARWSVARGDLPGIAAFGVVGIATLYGALSLAVEGGAALAVVLLYTAPAWVALFAWALLGERMTARKLLALAVTLLGIVGVATAGGGEVRPSVAALGWGLLAGLGYASIYLFGKRYFARYAPATVFVYAIPIAGLVLLPLTTFHPKSATAWVALLVLGVFSTYGAFLAYSAGLARLEATRAAVVATAEPVIGAGLAFVFWGERFAPLGYAAAGLVLLGVLLMASAPADPNV
jgi:DME family drug/metabolite transporter